MRLILPMVLCLSMANGMDYLLKSWPTVPSQLSDILYHNETADEVTVVLDQSNTFVRFWVGCDLNQTVSVQFDCMECSNISYSSLIHYSFFVTNVTGTNGEHPILFGGDPHPKLEFPTATDLIVTSNGLISTNTWEKIVNTDGSFNPQPINEKQYSIPVGFGLATPHSPNLLLYASVVTFKVKCHNLTFLQLFPKPDRNQIASQLKDEGLRFDQKPQFVVSLVIGLVLSFIFGLAVASIPIVFYWLARKNE
ncbi:hypothetical protein M3Y94_00071400 [Aphelenchoides besseyi]|nr:hypothetical protein M3Y94_00071400 [Aphelenchoides besseyi]KAI6237869.1 hypothetical protein M3Y95_00310000 [Aphelenchoides besseyi]